MNVLTITFYKDFARYFSYLEDEALSINPKVKFFNASLYPCAHAYWGAQGKLSTLLPFSCPSPDSPIAYNQVAYKGYNLDDLMRYTVSVFSRPDNDVIQRVKHRVASYIDYYEDFFSRENIDLIICSGDTRIPVEVCVACAQRRNIKIYYFEQGPFNTTIIDPKGVNANVSFSGLDGSSSEAGKDVLDEYVQGIKERAGGNYWRGRAKGVREYVADVMTLLLLNQPRMLCPIAPIELSTGGGVLAFVRSYLGSKFVTSRPTKRQRKDDNADERPYIALLLQVPHDAQMLVHSHLYSRMSDIVTDVLKSAPRGHRIVVREHPLFLGRYEKALYDQIMSSGVAVLDNDTDLGDLIDGAACVVVNNSTTGLDAMMRLKTVVTLGACYYASNGVVYRLRERTELPFLLKTAVESPIVQEKITRYLNWLVKEKLIYGHFQDKNLLNASVVLERMGLFGDEG